MIAQVREPVLEYPFVLEYLNYNTSSSYTRKKQVISYTRKRQAEGAFILDFPEL